MSFNPEAGSEGERRRLQQFLLQRGARFEPQDIDRIRLIQAQKLAGQLPVSEKLSREQKKKKRKARRKKNLRSEVARGIREQKRFREGERRDRPEEEPRIVGEPRVVGGVDPEVEARRLDLQQQALQQRQVQAIADRRLQRELQREELAVRRGELAAARAERARIAAAGPGLPGGGGPGPIFPPAPAAPDVRIGDIAPVINVPAQPPAQIVFMPDRPEPNIRDNLRAAAGELGAELRGQNREFHEILRDEAAAFRAELQQNVEEVNARQQAQDEQLRADAARQDAQFQDVYERFGQQEAAIGESRDAVIDEIRAQEERIARARGSPPPDFDDLVIDVDEFERSARAGLARAGLSPVDLTLSPRSPSLAGGSVRADPDNVVLRRPAASPEPEIETPIAEGVPPTPAARLPSSFTTTPEELEPAPQPERAEIGGGGPLDLPSVVIDARPAIDRSLEDDLLASEASRARFEADRGTPPVIETPAARQGPSPKTDAISRAAAGLRQILESGNRGEIAAQEDELDDLVDDAEAQPEVRLQPADETSLREGEVPVAQRVENLEGLQERSGGTSSAQQRWADLEAEFAAGEERLGGIAPSPTPRVRSPERQAALGTPRGEFAARVEPLLVRSPSPTPRIEEIDEPAAASAGGARVLEGGGGFIEEALSPRELEAGEEPLLEEVGQVKNKAQSRIDVSKRTFAGAQDTIFSDVRPGPRGPRAGGRGGIGFRVRNNTDRKLKRVEPGDVVNVLGGHAGNVVKLDTGAGTAGTRVGNAPFQRLIDDGSFLFEEGHRHELGGHFDANPYGPPVEPALAAAAGSLEEELEEVEAQPEVELEEESPGLLQQGAEAVGGALGTGARFAGGLAQGVGEGLYAQLPTAQEVGAGFGRAGVAAVSGAGRFAAGAIGGALEGEEIE